MRSFKIYTLSNFQIYNAVWLTRVTMLYVTSPELIYLTTKCSYLLTTFIHCAHHLPTSGKHQSVSHSDCPFYILPSGMQDFSFSVSSPILVISYLCDDSHAHKKNTAFRNYLGFYFILIFFERTALCMFLRGWKSFRWKKKAECRIWQRNHLVYGFQRQEKMKAVAHR